MKNFLKYIFVLVSSYSFAWCGGYEESWDGITFYNLFKQTNISAAEFYPFLRDADNVFYNMKEHGHKEKYYSKKGNIDLWKEVFTKWDVEEIKNAVYDYDRFDWTNKNATIEKRAKTYIEFAQLCSKAFSYRNNSHSWNYDKIIKQKKVDTKTLLSKGNLLLSTETNQQLKTRYYYQIIRILHYSQNWEEAIKFYESKIENKLLKNEIYYYIVDQIAGCYFSTKNYEKAAYLFTKVLNNSIDRKTSAYKSFSYCTNKNAQGKSFFEGKEDAKDLLFITSLRNFTDEIKNINQFINFDASDPRVELLFMRALNNVERVVWPKEIGVNDKTLPFNNHIEQNNKLLVIAEHQSTNQTVKNKDFWKMASSYLSFIKQDIRTAEAKLTNIKSFPDQKKTLSIIYKVFSWNTISLDNENYISKVLNDYPKQESEYLNYQNEMRTIILDKVAHTYYKNGRIAKAFLIHNTLESVNNINSLELLDALEAFYNKPNKSDYEKSLLANWLGNKDFLDYISHQKGIYYLYDRNPRLASIHFNKNTSFEKEKPIPNTIFSNNIIECFNCDVTNVMLDEVYKSNIFSFIKKSFSRKELADYLIELEKLTSNEKQWIAKLANYVLANYYFNISNTGYYRGILVNYDNCCDYNYITYALNKYTNKVLGAEVIANKSGYNLNNFGNLKKSYYNLSNTASKYYQKVIALSQDKELNARCLYLLAKCELNDYYNNGDKGTYTISLNEYRKFELPNSDAFSILKEEYSDTKFHEMIINECSYFKHYTAAH